MTNASRYDVLVDTRDAPLGEYKWIGNDFLTVGETEVVNTFRIAVESVDRSDGDREAGALEGSGPTGLRTLFALTIVGGFTSVTYGPDFISRSGTTTCAVRAPWGRHGLLLSSDDCLIELSGARVESLIDGQDVVLSNGRWWIACRGSSIVGRDGHSVTLRISGHTVIGVGSSRRGAVSEASDLARDTDAVVTRSRAAWERFLSSCPIVALSEVSPDWTHGLEASRFEQRQLWHWWAARANMVRPISNPWRVHPAPDRARWHGTWSSDGPLTLCALAMTSALPDASAAFAQYVRDSISSSGHLTWYTHPDGEPALGRLGNTAVLSHGLPDIVRAAEYIARYDPSVLDRPGVQGRSVYETLRWYLSSSFIRDVNGDGLWETSNLWESGWDNKVGPMFESAPVSEWVEALSSSNLPKVARFVRLHSRPTTTMVEQFSHLMALEAMAVLAERRGDAECLTEVTQQSQTIRTTIQRRHWNPSTNTYRDWDVHGNRLTDADCLDGFYYLAFEGDPQRASAMLEVLRDESRFGLRRPPTLARDHPLFRSSGYWDGSHWPREMLYLALGLNQQDQGQDAFEVLTRALESGVGSEILEHVDSRTGEHLRFHANGATVYTQAMSVGICIGLLEVVRGDTWWPSVAPNEEEDR